MDPRTLVGSDLRRKFVMGTQRFASVRLTSSGLGITSFPEVERPTSQLALDLPCTRMYQHILSLSMFSGQVTWPVCTEKDKGIS